MIQTVFKTTPKAALWLGLSGAIPFVGLAMLSLLGLIWAPTALLAYGTAILSFMGGIHWGLAMAQNELALPRLGAAVSFALIGWSAFLLGGAPGFLIMAAGFASLLTFDLKSVGRGEAPTWYPELRRPLTLIVVLSLLAGAFS